MYSIFMSQNVGVRSYGNPSHDVVVIHGGPGAPGYMAPVARELSRFCGVIEPLQASDSMDGQISELYSQISAKVSAPIVFIGSSWGAVLALLTAARYPDLAKKIVLVGSAVFDVESSKKVKAIRLERTPPETLHRIRKLEQMMIAAERMEKNRILAQIAELEFDTDAFDPLTRNLELIDTQPDLNQSVWKGFVELRNDPNRLRKTLSKISCETVIVHGDYDPHPIDGIQPFLTSCLPTVRLEWLEKCGHYPWIEKAAKERFFQILKRECS